MKLIIFIPFMVLILGTAVVGGIYYFQTQPPSPTSPLAQGPVTNEPASLTLEVTAPNEDTLSFDTNIVVSGRTAPESEVLISSEVYDLVVQSKKDGSFSTLFDLAEGVNNLQITVFDSAGDERSLAKTVYYTKEKLP
jgi:hypothetical protein